jgi:hypothetical protein
VLLVPTLLIICGLIRLVFKYGRNQDGEESITASCDYKTENRET